MAHARNLLASGMYEPNRVGMLRRDSELDVESIRREYHFSELFSHGVPDIILSGIVALEFDHGKVFASRYDADCKYYDDNGVHRAISRSRLAFLRRT